MMGEMLALPSDADINDLAVEILRLAIRRGLDEPTLAAAMADALGHTCATLDLREGRRDVDRRLAAFRQRVEETYKRSLLRRRTGLTDAHGRPIP